MERELQLQRPGPDAAAWPEAFHGLAQLAARIAVPLDSRAGNQNFAWESDWLVIHGHPRRANGSVDSDHWRVSFVRHSEWAAGWLIAVQIPSGEPPAQPAAVVDCCLLLAGPWSPHQERSAWETARRCSWWPAHSEEPVELSAALGWLRAYCTSAAVRDADLVGSLAELLYGLAGGPQPVRFGP